MTNEKLQHLSDMDFQWSVMKERNNATWDQRFEELKKFRDEHGHCRVPRVPSRSGKLGKWVDHQRYNKSIRAARSEERIAKLEAIGFFDS